MSSFQSAEFGSARITAAVIEEFVISMQVFDLPLLTWQIFTASRYRVPTFAVYCFSSFNALADSISPMIITTVYVVEEIRVG